MKNSKIILGVILIFLIIGINHFNPTSKLKYVFLFIGDGMGSNQVELTEIYNNVINDTNYDKQNKLSFSNFPIIGIRKNYDKSSYVPDSASSATALSSGILTTTGKINVNNNIKSKPITYDIKKQRNMKIGILSTVPIIHATPAAFYASSEDRNNNYEIAEMLLNSNFDYFGDGGFSLTATEKNDIYQKLKDKGYDIAVDKQQIENIKSDKLITINPTNNNGTTNYEIDGNELPLSYFVKKGIDVLNNKSGFFMMIESGLIDYACHNNDTKGVISEVNVLNDAVNEALKFYKKHPNETLIIVTSDHETGGLSLGNDTGFGIFLEKLKFQKKSFSNLESYLKKAKTSKYSFNKVLKYLDENYGISKSDKTKFLLTKNDETILNEYYNQENYDEFKKIIINIISNDTKISWSSNNHTASLINVYSKGVGSKTFGGNYSSIEFNDKLRKVLKLK